MLLTKSKGGGAAAATSVDELKKQASAAAVAKAVEVIKNGGTQADAAAAAKLVARDILAKGQQQMHQKSTSKEKKNGLMGKLRKPRQNKPRENKPRQKKQQAASPSKQRQPTTAAKSYQSPRRRPFSPEPDSTTTASTDDDGTFTDSRTESSGADASSFSSSSDKASEVSSRAGDSKSTNSKISQNSKPTIYVDAKEGDKDNVSVISDVNTRTSASTIHVVDLLNMGGVMRAIDKALEEQDVQSEMKRGGLPKRTWLDKLFSCDMCFGPDNMSYASSVSGDEPSILSKDAPSVLSGGDKNNALDTVEEENEEDSSDTAGADAAAKGKDSAPVSPRSGLKKKTEGPQEEKVKQSVSLVQDGITKAASPRNSKNVSAGDAAVSSAPPPKPARAPPEPVTAPPKPANEGTKSPVTVTSKSNSKDDDSSRSSPAWKLFGKSTPKKQETSEVTTQPKAVEQQQQAPETRQDSTVDWRSMVTDLAPNPNPNHANRNKAPIYDPQRSNPSVFIPSSAQSPRGEIVNFGSPMNGQGYGYGLGSSQHSLNYFPTPPTSPYGGSNYGVMTPPPLSPSVSSHRTGLHGASLSMDESAYARVDKYGGDEAVMISDAAAKSKSQLEDAASFVYRLVSGDNKKGGGDDASVGTTHTQQRDDVPKGGYQQQYNPYGGPPSPHYYPPQQYQGQYPPHPHQQYSPHQQYHPQHYQGQYPPQQQYPPHHQQQQYPPQQNYPRIDPNPSSLTYYDQVQVSSPMHHQQFAA